ncbi:MAG: hypothetical protein U5N86_12590 [Planctomycetota bacterium]|nr:hypothetical protein [Planctomycetota bacterium]
MSMFVRLLLERALCFRFGGLVASIPTTIYFFDTFVFVSPGQSSAKLYLFGIVFLFSVLIAALLPFMGYEGLSTRASAERLMASGGAQEYVASVFLTSFVLSLVAGFIVVLNGISLLSLEFRLVHAAIACCAVALGAAGACAVVHVIAFSSGIRGRLAPAVVLFVLAGLSGWYFDMRMWNGQGLEFGPFLGTLKLASFPHWVRTVVIDSLTGDTARATSLYIAALTGLGVVGYSVLRGEYFLRGTK